MKQWNCNACYKDIEVYDEYEPEMCCSGLREHCACMGQPINPVFCDECEEKIFGNTRKDWPEYIPTPTDEDIFDMAELSERNTGSSFFETDKIIIKEKLH